MKQWHYITVNGILAAVAKLNYQRYRWQLSCASLFYLYGYVFCFHPRGIGISELDLGLDSNLDLDLNPDLDPETGPETGY